ncbi:hypothetical protein CDV50_15530 [Haematobacter massiliensis]|uniref:Uncharacterized protein n=1 Tax=Haematobacter massiliensis TaxID=195105 RepID=A0A086Y599_9RHOB|nr:hypothetical protein CN97_16785 [Haematobacter massiliensis]OWJ69871.1 hypothetical protein CDV50_15530 [Haematobacter massiliensis]OWJ83681.1 hypothetical protein CDV51_15580 [Haematobacter massiliensis]
MGFIGQAAWRNTRLRHCDRPNVGGCIVAKQERFPSQGVKCWRGSVVAAPRQNRDMAADAEISLCARMEALSA